MTESGTNVRGLPGSESRFSPFAGVSSVETQGEYLNYSFTATASGLQGVPVNGGFQDDTGRATGLAGAFNALFQNTGGNPSLEGFYNIHLNLNNLTNLDSSFTYFVHPADNYGAVRRSRGRHRP